MHVKMMRWVGEEEEGEGRGEGRLWSALLSWPNVVESRRGMKLNRRQPLFD